MNINKSVCELQLEIQGLRATAVLAVLLFHIWPDWLPGGYVGVDVFFVISGYLITGLLLREAQNTGGISLWDFYARRIRRLLPASALVIFVSCLCVVLLPQVQWVDTAKEGLASSLYLQNWWLAHKSVDYLAEDTSASLLRHYWSLSVEEQYYILWPLIFILLIKCWTSLKDHPERVFAWMAITFGILSFAYSIFLTKQNPGLAYFSTGTRAWELSLGSLLAVWRLHLKLIPDTLRTILGWTGLTLIFVACVNYNQSTSFPGFAAILPTLGAAFVIAAGYQPQQWAGGRLLCLKPLLYIGDISYSLYLWHWPVIIVFGAVLGVSEVTFSQGVAIISLSVLLAHLTKKWVEDPFRYGWVRWPLLNSPGLILATSLGLALLVTAPILFRHHHSETVPVVWKVSPDLLTRAYDPLSPTIPPLASSRADNPDVYRLGCHVDQRSDEPKTCTFGPPLAQRVVALIGDSHAAQWLPALQEVFRERPDWKIVTFTKSACAFNTVTVTIGKQGLPYESCVGWNQAVMAELARLRPDVIVMSASNTYRVYGTQDKTASLNALTNGLVERWRQLLQTGSQVVVLRDTPRMKQNIPECLSAANRSVADCTTPLSEALRPDPIVMAVKRMPVNTSGLTYLDLTDQICEATVCKPLKGQVLIWRDSHHMTSTFSRLLSVRLGELFFERNILLEND